MIRTDRSAVLAIGLALAWIGCAQSASVAGDCSGELKRARSVARKINDEWPLRSPDYVTKLVEDVVWRLASAERPRRWEIVVFRSRKPEANSIGDGRIYISDGAVRACETESELAAILAHEMAHQLLGDFCEASSNSLGTRLLTIGSVSLRVDPAKEREADRVSLDLIARVGYDPRAALSIVSRVQRGMPRGHLDDMDRVPRLEGMMSSYAPRDGFQTERFVEARQRLQAERGLRSE